MSTQIDGVYSVASSGIGGSSLATIKIENGSFVGNDTAGSRWSGNVTDNGNGTAKFDVAVTFGPNVFGIWGTSPSETFQTRQVVVDVPFSALDGQPYTIPSFDLTLIFRRISEDFAGLAGPNGLDEFIGSLQAIRDAWRNYDAQ
ncbi:MULTISPECIES: hypothetical protein [unclassified Mesorhizobium]|uniref:hypothetical protein n=1 Tax=unclassified Mesorhizobium TaxID=325217 RepID=UPI00112E243F|nr:MULTISPECIES: hypothetical protein [unclassified Mesorhizobium]MCA0026662.1 hypothetical protein [Mesorhizobium sp. B263B1A]TPJ84075.1 hypothetical protein FJ422_17590 [Mesorhizobium sp. B2-6-3]TPJ89379.1 hypothetical protein FJ489_29355 [Mesorhizobium sp. B2-5-12]TPK19335.1 hypothetical protein FJ562_30595 [Mesorhizobium sp. B2-5-6]